MHVQHACQHEVGRSKASPALPARQDRFFPVVKLSPAGPQLRQPAELALLFANMGAKTVSSALSDS